MRVECLFNVLNVLLNSLYRLKFKICGIFKYKIVGIIQLPVLCLWIGQISRKILKLCFKRIGALNSGLLAVKKVSNVGKLPATSTPGW